MRAPAWLKGMLRRGVPRPDIELTPRERSAPTVQRWITEPQHVRLEFEDQRTASYVSIRFDAHQAMTLGVGLTRAAAQLERERGRELERQAKFMRGNVPPYDEYHEGEF